MSIHKVTPEQRRKVLEHFTQIAIAYRGNDPYNTADHWKRYFDVTCPYRRNFNN